MTTADRRPLLEKLQKLSEKRLTEAVVFPLLETMGFDNIEERHGPYEKGKDILCLRRDELDELELLAIQVKKLKFSGNIGGRRVAAAVLIARTCAYKQGGRGMPWTH
jgi:hypothetical protein